MRKELKVNKNNPIPGVYIGDPCYILPGDFYDEFWGKQNNFEDGAFEKNGRPVMIVCGTAYGDGCYDGEIHERETDSIIGYNFPVDAGCLAIVNLEFADPEKVAEMRGNPDALGVVIEKPCTGMLLDYDDGEFRFYTIAGDEPGKSNETYFVHIETRDVYEDEEEEDDWDNYYEEEEEENGW